MSVFQVNLHNFAANSSSPVNNLSYNGIGGGLVPGSIYVAGPNRTMRVLKDGQQFTDTNYWKRFAYPQVALKDAFITVITDDGSVWDDHDPDGAQAPVGYTITCAASSSFTANQMAILSDNGATANFAQITNGGAQAVKLRLNGVSTAVLSLAAGATQVFQPGDLNLSLVEVDNSTGTGAAVITALYGLQVISAD